MRFIGRVSLFCIIGLLGFLAGAYANSIYLQWFYPNRIEQQAEHMSDNIADRTQTKASFRTSGPDTNMTEMSESVPVENRGEQVITCDTVFMIEEYDKNTDITASHKEEIPGKYMGMDRESFVDAMASYAMSPPLQEQKRGLIAVEVLTFSRERVTIRKSYHIVEEPDEKLFYLVAEDHYITVYTQDMKEVYLYTDIRVETLPWQLQEEIIQKKLISGEASLYYFLESYSS